MLIYSRYNINGGFLMKKIISFALVLSMLLLVLCSCGSKKTIAKIEVENYGTITVELYPDIAPITVKNFVNLAKKGFYNGLTFHRIMDGFMIQGGDPLGNGTGGNTDSQGNRLTIKGEFTANGVNNTLSHKRGVISMARAQDYNSASSQFFIMHKDAAYLDGAYAAFGQVTSGMEVRRQDMRRCKAHRRQRHHPCRKSAEDNLDND